MRTPPSDQELARLRRANRVLRKSLHDVVGDLDKARESPDTSVETEAFLQRLIDQLKRRLAEVDAELNPEQ